MEKIKINGQIFNLIPMGIGQSEKKRSFTISSGLTSAEIESAFTDVTRIEHLNEVGEILSTFIDGVSVKTIHKNMEDGTYTIEISTDAIERKIRELGDAQTYAELALVEVYELLLGVMM